MSRKKQATLIVVIGVLAIIGLYMETGYTGFAVLAQEGSPHPFYIFAVLLVISILLVGVFWKKDALQEKLKEMEEESPSPSLENTSQTKEEQKYFKKRNGYIPFLSKVKKKKQDPQAYVKEPDYQEDISKEIDSGQVKTPRREELNSDNTQNHINKLRDLIEKKRGIESEIERGIYNETRKKYDSLKEELEKTEFTTPRFKARLRDRFDSSIDEKLKSAHEREGQKWNQYITNRKGPVSYSGIKSMMEKLNNLRDILGYSKITLKSALKGFFKHAKTRDVSEVVDNNSQWLIHAVPYGTDYTHVENNPFMNKYVKEKGYRPEDLTMEDFLDFVLEKKPTLSGSVLNYSNDPTKPTSPIGVIYKEGRIYDATSNAGQVTQNSADVPYAKLRVEANLDEEGKDLDTRIKDAKNSYQYNEFIVGGENAEILGVYYTPVHQNYDQNPKIGQDPMTKQKMWRRKKSDIPYETLNRIAQYAIDKGLPLYRFEKNRGFVKEDPNKVKTKEYYKKNIQIDS